MSSPLPARRRPKPCGRSAPIRFWAVARRFFRCGELSVDAVIDNVAGPDFGLWLKLLRPGGRYASSGAIAGPMVQMDWRDAYLKDITLFGCTAWDEPVFPNLIAYIERDEIRPLLVLSFALSDIAEAQRVFLKKEHVGNFVLIPPSI